ncbi:MAG TPA: hypothetical protein VF210_20825 [Pseudomonadales bacterium]
MEVEAHTSLTAPEVQARLEALEHEAAAAFLPRRLVYERSGDRSRLYLSGRRFAPRPTAEVAVDGYHRGAAVVLRPMWGPLPALWPRALTLIGLGLATAVLLYLGRDPLHWLLAAAAVALPMAAFVVQRLGERRLQERLGEVLGGAGFAATAADRSSPRPRFL